LGTLAFFTLTRLLAVSLNPAHATSWQAELETPLPYDRAMLSFVCQVACAVGIRDDGTPLLAFWNWRVCL
jgi:hypothetical protein